MPRLIQDEFSNKRISRQRRYQLRKEAKGCCRICGKKTNGPLCPEHDDKQIAAMARWRARQEAMKLV